MLFYNDIKSYVQKKVLKTLGNVFHETKVDEIF